jgi:outer membrane protein
MTFKRMRMLGGLGLLAALLAVSPSAAEPEAGVALSLQDALKTALQKNFDIRVQKITLEQSNLNLKGAYGLYDPQLSLNWYSTINRQPTTSILQAGAGASLYQNRTDAYNLQVDQMTPWGQGFRLTWDNARSKTNSSFFTLNPSYTSSGELGTTLPLLQGFGTQVANRTVLKAKLDRSIADRQFSQNLRDTLLQVEQDYWNLVFAIKDLKVKESSLDLAKRFQEETRKKIDVGVLAPIEQISADAQVATREQDIIAAQQSVGDRQDILKLALGISQDSPEWGQVFSPTDEPSVAAAAGAEPELIDEALATRPEIKQFEDKISKDKLDTRWAKNQTLPQLNLTASLTYNGSAGHYVDPMTGIVYDQGYSDAWRQITGLDYKSYYVGLSFVYPIGNRSARAQYQSTRLAQNADEISYQRLKLSVANEVRAALRGLQAAQKRVAAAEVTLKLQQDKLDAEQKKYENGLSTAFNVLSYQNDLTTAQSGLLSAQIAAQIAGATLDRAVGTYLETHGVDLVDVKGNPIE